MATGRKFKVTNGLDNNANQIDNIGATGAHLTRSGAHVLTLTTTATTNATLPSGTVTLAKTSGETMTNLILSGTLTAGGGNGTNGQLLSSTGTGVQWINAPATGVQGTGTTNTIAYWVDSTTIGALATATYPSLTELSYVKGVTSAIQTQLNAKANDSDVVKLTGDQTIAGNKTFSNNVIISGDFTVNGTTTNINTTNLVVEDKNIIVGDVTSPTNTTADGGGITLKGTTDKTINWVNSTGAWTSSEDFNLASGKVYKINGTQIAASNLSNGTTGTGKVVLEDTPTLIGARLENTVLLENVDWGQSVEDDVTVTTTSTTTFNQILFSTSQRGAELLIQSGDGTNYQVTKLLATHDGTTVYLTEYGTVLSGSAVASYDMDISGGFVRLKITAASATSTTHKAHWVALDA